jgi:hypothetical protein
VPQPPSRVARRARCAATTTASGDRAQLVAPAGLAAPAGRPRLDGTLYRRARRSRSARTSTRSTTRSSGARDPSATDGRRARRGLHFVVFNPTSDDFHRNRLAMDGSCPAGEARRSSRARRAGLQLDPRDDAPAELPRPAEAPPRLPLAELRRPRASGGCSLATHLAEERFRHGVPVLGHRLQLGGRLGQRDSTIRPPCNAAMRPEYGLGRRGPRPSARSALQARGRAGRAASALDVPEHVTRV